jgi:TPR repeat protein
LRTIRIDSPECILFDNDYHFHSEKPMGNVVALPPSRPHPAGWRTMALNIMSDRDLDVALGGQEAAAWVDAAAGSGMAEAQVRLGRLLLAQPRDPRAAFACFLCAASSGHAEGIFLLGRCYEKGWGVAPNLLEARNCYRRAGEAGDCRGAYDYASLAARDGDLETALPWFEAALRLAPDGAREQMRSALSQHPLDAVRALALA